jgi:hypothetical protein
MTVHTFKFACKECMAAMPGPEALTFIPGPADGGFCNKAKHFYCQNPSCYSSKLAKPEWGGNNEAWFLCGSCGQRSYFTTRDRMPNFIYKTELPT